MPLLKRRPSLANWLLVAAFLGCLSLLFVFGQFLQLAQQFGSQNTLVALLGVLAMYLYFLLPGVLVWLAITLLLLIPLASLILLLGWVFRRYKRRQAERQAYQQHQLAKSFSPPSTPPQQKPMPLMQRQFRH